MDVKQLLSKMTLREKLAQMSQYNSAVIMPSEDGLITGPASELNLTEKDVATTGSILGTQGATALRKIQEKHLAEDPNKIPMLFMADVIHGHTTIYPVTLAMGATFDPDLLAECAYMSAKESAVSGLHVTFNPMVDLSRDARWGRVMESTGEDPYLNSVMAKAQVRGYQGDFGKYNICACVKHFACYGGAEAGRDYNTVDISERSFRDYYLPAYKAAIDAGVGMVMTSFNLINGVPSTGNVRLMRDILRDEWGFDGVVITDYNAVLEQLTHGYAQDAKDCAKKAITAGSDIEMMTSCYITHGEDLVKSGELDEKLIDECTLRILELKDKLGLFENPMRSASEDEEKKLLLCKEHRDLVRRAAEKSAVLLKNDGVLPLSTDLKTLALIGPYIDDVQLGNWAGYGKKEDGVSVLQGVKNLTNAKILTAQGADGSLKELPNAKLIKQAVKVAKKADAVILCIGEHSKFSGESQSKADIDITPAQKELVKQIVKANPNTVAVLYNGRPLVLTDIIDYLPSLMVAWQPGTEGGNAIANLLFGKTNFEGKLTMSFPRATGQAPIYYNIMNTGRPNIEDTTDCHYRSRYIDCKNSPLFAFGYGLSYTKFTVSKPTLSNNTLTRGEVITASATVKNIGYTEGTLTVQLYIHDKVASLVRPVKELKGFKKVTLKPNEEQVVTFDITEDTLKFFSANNKFESELGEFEVFIGQDSTVTDLATFTLL